MSKIAYVNGDVITVNPNNEVVDGILIENGRILRVGSKEEILALGDGNTQIVDLEGKAMLPGFIDPHGHMVAVAQTRLLIDCSQCRSKEELLQLLNRNVQEGSRTIGGWLLGFGYDNSQFHGQLHPTKFDLDSVSSEIPIFLSHVSGHLAVANSAALQKLGYAGENYAVPEGGVVRTVSPASKEPNGVLEENAYLAAEKKRLLPAPTFSQLMDALTEAQDLYCAQGITTAQDASVDHGIHRLLLAAANGGKLKIDVVGYAVQKATFTLLEDAGVPERESVNHYKLLGGKTWLDGSPQGKTAWLTQPYWEPPKGQEPGYCGYGTQTDEAVLSYFQGCIQRNLQVNVHANGDAAADQFLRCYRKALETTNPTAKLRPVMVHAQTVREDQLDQMKALGILPTFFLDHIWFWGDYYYESILGPERAEGISPAGSAVKKGIPFTLHQDPPVKMPNPLLAIHNAVNRRTQKGRVLGKEQKISVMEAIRGVTINGAYQYFEEDQKGSLEPGKYADLVILDRSPLRVSTAQIKNIQVLETIKQGETLWKRS